MQESKQEVTKVVSLVKMAENLPSVSGPHIEVQSWNLSVYQFKDYNAMGKFSRR